MAFFRKIFFLICLLSSSYVFGQSRTLVIVAHPNLDKSQVNKQLVQAISSEKNITAHDLYLTYPDEKVDVIVEQKLLETHEIIVFQFPLYWFSAPSLLKKWQDEVITSKFALGKTNPLKGKRLLIAVSAGGTNEDFRHEGLMNATIDEVLAPYKAFANLCGMKYLSPFVSYGVPNPQILDIPMTEEEKASRKVFIDKQARAYLELLKKLQGG